MTRTEAIIQLLCDYTTARDPLFARTANGTDDRLPLMPASWTHSMRELDRCLHRLRTEHRDHYWHVAQRYIVAAIIVRDIPVVRGRPKLPANHEHVAGAIESGSRTGRLRLRTWDPRVDPRKVRHGVELLAAWFHGEPFILEEHT